MSDALLTIRELTFGYQQESPLFAAKHLAVYPGKITALIGPNGAGKSTLLELMTGYLTPWSGDIFLGETPLQNLTQQELGLKMALVPQHPPEAAGFTVQEMVSLGRTPHLGLLPFETKADMNIVEDAMKTLNVDHLADQLFSVCSGGEKERILIARALAQQPDILLMDEPTANQDLSQKAKVIRALVHLLKEKNMGMLMVTHDWNLAMSLDPVVYTLAKGELRLEEEAHLLGDDLIERIYGEGVRAATLSDGRRILLPAP